MTARHMAADRVGAFVRAWRRRFSPQGVDVVTGAEGVHLLLADLETLSRPRQVIRTIPQLCALAPRTVIMVQSGRAAQIEAYEDCDEHGELIVVKKLLYVGTDLDDYLHPPDRLYKETPDTLRRMLPAIVIDPLD